MGLTLQDPSYPGQTLLDALVDAADGADRGGAIFAFASANGVNMFLSDSTMQALLRTAPFDLVVGLDAITSQLALDAITKASNARPNLAARGFLHGIPTLFHPKLAWFAHGGELTLVTGSGNLTPGGLTTNFEAFVVSRYAGSEAAAVEKRIADWLSRWNSCLLALDDPKVVAQAKENSGAERSLRKPMKQESEESGPPPTPPPAAQVLVAEITKNAPERTQVDIGETHFSSFFGGQRGHKKRIVIRHLDPGDQLQDAERPRALIETKSHNYRFEAGGRGRKDYPATGRPIGVFVRSPDGVFVYRLIWPGEPGHSELTAFLDKAEGTSGVRRHATDLSTLRNSWSGCPF